MMENHLKTKIFQHLNPVWHEKANFIIGAWVPPLDSAPAEEAWEQLWSLRLSERQFEICCIPIFAYNLALGDIVKTDRDHMITGLVKPSGHKTFRVWLQEETKTLSEKIVIGVENMGFLIEWYSPRLFGIDVESLAKVDEMILFLSELEAQDHLTFETGNL